MGRAGPAAQFWLMDKVHSRPSQSDMLVPFSESPTGTLLPSRRRKVGKKRKPDLGLGRVGWEGAALRSAGRYMGKYPRGLWVGRTRRRVSVHHLGGWCEKLSIPELEDLKVLPDDLWIHPRRGSSLGVVSSKHCHSIPSNAKYLG